MKFKFGVDSRYEYRYRGQKSLVPIFARCRVQVKKSNQCRTIFHVLESITPSASGNQVESRDTIDLISFANLGYWFFLLEDSSSSSTTAV